MVPAPTTGALTIDFGGVTQTGCFWLISEYGDTDTSGVNGSAAVVQSATNLTAGATSLTVTLAAFGNSNNGTYGVFSHSTNEDSTRGSGFTTGPGGYGVSPPSQGFRSEWRVDNDTTVDMSWATSSPAGGIALEIKYVTSGHAPQVNERPLSQTNGWSIAATAVKTEEYNIEGQTVGDINLSGATLVDYTGWVHAKALLAETGQIRVNNVDTNVSLTSTITTFTKIAGSTTYPAATGTDIGLLTSATVTTVSLYEAGIMFAYIPAAAGGTLCLRALLGVGC